MTVIAGKGKLTWPGERHDGALHIGIGDTLVVPACVARFQLVPSEHLNVMVCDPGVR